MGEIITTVGRLVWGNPLKSQIKMDRQKNKILDKEGREVTQWAFGVAFPKADFSATIWPEIAKEAALLFGAKIPPNFAYKYKDGDSVDGNGQPYSTRDGYTGCCVLSISTVAFAPPVFKLVNSAYIMMTDGIKTGDYLRLSINIKGHSTAGYTPGVYINPVAVEFVGYGQEIFGNQADAMSIFGGQAVALPTGASAAPVASGAMPGMGVQQPGGMPGMPHHGFVNPNGQ